MYLNYPDSTQVIPQFGTGQGDVKFQLQFQMAQVPQRSADFLRKLGWLPQNNHPDTQEQLFHKPPPNDSTDVVRTNWDSQLNFGHWHWYEAMAYEFGKFMGIEDDTSESQVESGEATLGRAQTASVGAAT